MFTEPQVKKHFLTVKQKEDLHIFTFSTGNNRQKEPGEIIHCQLFEKQPSLKRWSCLNPFLTAVLGLWEWEGRRMGVWQVVGSGGLYTLYYCFPPCCWTRVMTGRWFGGGDQRSFMPLDFLAECSLETNSEQLYLSSFFLTAPRAPYQS